MAGIHTPNWNLNLDHSAWCWKTPPSKSASSHTVQLFLCWSGRLCKKPKPNLSSQNKANPIRLSLTAGLVFSFFFFFCCFLHLLSLRFLDTNTSRSNTSPKTRFIDQKHTQKCVYECAHACVCWTYGWIISGVQWIKCVWSLWVSGCVHVLMLGNMREEGGRSGGGREGGSRLSVNIRRGRGREEERMMGG